MNQRLMPHPHRGFDAMRRSGCARGRTKILTKMVTIQVGVVPVPLSDHLNSHLCKWARHLPKTEAICYSNRMNREKELEALRQENRALRQENHAFCRAVAAQDERCTWLDQEKHVLSEALQKTTQAVDQVRERVKNLEEQQAKDRHDSHPNQDGQVFRRNGSGPCTRILM